LKGGAGRGGLDRSATIRAADPAASTGSRACDGTVRSYIALGYNFGGSLSGIQGGNQTAPGTNLTLAAADPGVGFSANRAFIQFAGFTFGVTQSFYDFYSQSATSFWGGMINPASDSGDAGDFIWGAYTAQFGNGLSATLAAEQPRTTAVLNGSSANMFVVAAAGASASAGVIGAAGNLGIQPASSAEANQWPDIVANLRVDQAWGSAQIMGAIHDVAATYYGAGTNDVVGHPTDEIGWAVGAGIKLLTPMIGAGDYFQAQVNYTQGARKYVDFSYNNMYSLFNGNSYGIGLGSDGVYAGSSGAPYSESSPVRPLSAYGETKLLQESLARAWSRQTGTPTLIGRISNLYGPDQDLSKNQGLITQVCARAIIRQPLILYVPLDTIRDYLFARDAAALIADGLERLRVTVAASCDTPVVMKILASHQPTTVATVLGQVRRVTKRPVSVVVARTPHARPQPPDLRMASTVWSELDRRPLTTLSAGIQAVVTDLVCRAGRGVLVAGHAPNRSAGLGSGTAINGQHCSQDDRAR